jgi:hypothetical protein
MDTGYNPEPFDALGPCGCIDYHYSDCPLRDVYVAEAEPVDDDWYPEWENEGGSVGEE